MKLDDVKKLHQKKYRTQFGYYLVEGEHLVLELEKALLNEFLSDVELSQKTQSQKVQAQTNNSQGPSSNDIPLYVTQEHEQWARRLEAGFAVVTVNNKQMAQLSDTKTPQGIIACVPMPRVVQKQSKPNTRYIYLHEIQDPGNLGTIIRTLAWFGNFRLLLSPNSVDPFNPKVVRSSMGAIFHVPIELDVELADLPLRFSSFAYLDMQGSSINTPEFASFDCYLFGNEARGVPLDVLSDLNANAFTIAGSGIIDSLNVASALNICAYQLST
jgi:TrmH family RNA methyltransferase